MGVRIDVQMTVKLDAVVDQIIGGLQTGVGLAGERLLALSSELVPHDLGTLQASGAVSTPLASHGSDPVSVVSYDTPYAARHHEHPEYNFQGGRQGKYLEQPAVEHRKELGNIIRQAVTDAVQ